MLHSEKENDMNIQKIKAARPYLRGQNIDSEKIKSYRKLEKMQEINSLNSLGGFKKLKVEENQHNVTEKVKQQRKKKFLFEENKFNEFLLKRKKEKSQGTDFSKIKCRERDYIYKQHFPMIAGNETIELRDEKEEIDIDHYKNLINLDNKKKDQDNSNETPE